MYTLVRNYIVCVNCVLFNKTLEKKLYCLSFDSSFRVLYAVHVNWIKAFAFVAFHVFVAKKLYLWTLICSFYQACSSATTASLSNLLIYWHLVYPSITLYRWNLICVEARPFEQCNLIIVTMPNNYAMC